MELYTQKINFNSRLNSTVLSLLFLFTGIINAQLSEDYKVLKKKYPNATFLRINQEKKIIIKLVNGKPEIEEFLKNEDIYLTKSASYGAKQEIGFSSFSDIKDLKASSYVFDGKKYIKNVITNFTESDDVGVSFYDDSKKITFFYEGLKEGVKTDVSYTRVIKNPRFLSSYFFGDRFPIIKNKLTIQIDNAIQLDLKKFGFEKIEGLLFSKKTGKKQTKYIWELSNSAKIDLESDAPNFRKRLPSIVPIITSFKTNNGEEKVISGGVQELYNWYYSLALNSEEGIVDKVLESLVKELVKNKDSDIEKVRAIYYCVQENIKYIAFEYALGGFVPRTANTVFSRKYGDCKDNSSILKEMLKIAGLKGYLTWIGTRSIPFTYAELPTPSVDNHMIMSYVSNNGKVYFLDATGRYLSLETPSSFIQGKEALIGLDKENYRIEKVPVVAANKNIYKDSIYVKLKETGLLGQGKIELDGYPKTDFFTALERVKTVKEKQDFYNRYLTKGSNHFLIDNFSEKNKFSYDAPFSVNYKFNIENYVNTYEDEIYVNMNFFEGIDNLKTTSSRKSGRDYDYKRLTQLVSVLEIPEEVTIIHIPKDYYFKNENFECKITYKEVEGKLILNYNIKQDFITLNLEEQKIMNTIVTDIKKQQKNVIVLKKKNT